MELVFSKRFQKQARKLVENNPKLKEKISICLGDFSAKERKSEFYRKPLKGRWYGHEELQIGGDLRIVVRVSKNKEIAVMEMIGTHAQLNL